MLEFGIRPPQSGVTDLGITEGKAHWNLPPEQLAMIALDRGQARMTAAVPLQLIQENLQVAHPKTNSPSRMT